MSDLRRGGAGTQKPVEEFVLTMPAVEAVAELVQVLLDVSVAEAVECPDDEHLGSRYPRALPVGICSPMLRYANRCFSGITNATVVNTH
jgi:hypothetical protein